MLSPSAVQKNKLLRAEQRFPCGSAVLYVDLRFYPEDGGRRFLRNVGKLPLDYTVPHARIQYSRITIHTHAVKQKYRAKSWYDSPPTQFRGQRCVTSIGWMKNETAVRLHRCSLMPRLSIYQANMSAELEVTIRCKSTI
jgi:hypothetical protein